MLLITKEDIKKYRPIADIDYPRLDIYIEEAQQFDLKPMLGDALYYDFINNYTDTDYAKYADYQKLLNGVNYTYSGNTIQFAGVKPLVVYYMLSRFVVQNPVHFTRFGVVQKTQPNSTPISTEQIRLQASELKGIGANYQAELRKYLIQEGSNYPLYDNNNKQAERTGFNFFSV